MLAVIANKVAFFTRGFGQPGIMTIGTLAFFRGFTVAKRFAADHTPGAIFSHNPTTYSLIRQFLWEKLY